jgi:AcrR family transcriptional regulator
MSLSHIKRLPNAPAAARSGAGAAPHPPAAIGRRQRRAAETRLRIFRCALELIAERGLANVTVEDITEAADVGKGTFFNYFASKDHVVGVMAEIQLGKIREAVERVRPRSQKTEVVLRRMVRRLAEEPGRSPNLARALILSLLASAEVRLGIRDRMGEARRMIATIIAAGQAVGEIDTRLNPKDVAAQLLQACFGTALLWSLDERPNLASRFDETFRHFWRSIAVSGGEKQK